MYTYHIIVPQVFRVIFPILISHMIVDALNFMVLVLTIWISNVIFCPFVFFKFFKVLYVINVVGDFYASTGHPNVLICDSRFFLLF